MKHDNLSDDMEQVENYLQELQKLPTKPVKISTEELKGNNSWTELQPEDLTKLEERKEDVLALAKKLEADETEVWRLGKHNNVGYEVYADFGDLKAKVILKATGEVEVKASTQTINLHKGGDNE